MAVNGGGGPEFAERKEGTQVIHVRGDSDSLMNSLFDSVLKKQESTMPLQVPLSMRKLPKSFFNPPSHGSRSPASVSHSRTSSTDSTHAGGATLVSAAHQQAAVCGAVPPLHASHMRAHSSPATLQQTYSAAVQHQQPAATAAQNAAQTAHVKQASFDVLADGGGVMPPGWEQACTSHGQTYFINHIEKTTTWEDPRKKMHAPHALFHSANSQSPTSAPQGAAVLSSQLQQLSVNNAAAAAAAASANNTSNNGTNTGNGGVSGAVTGALPDGWVQAETEDGEVYFINHMTRTTSWFDPRIPERLQRPTALLTSSPSSSAPSATTTSNNNNTAQQQQQQMSPAGAAVGSPQQQLLQQRHQSLRVQQLKLESERLRICKRQVMKQWVQDGQSLVEDLQDIPPQQQQQQQLLAGAARGASIALDSTSHMTLNTSRPASLRTGSAGPIKLASLEPFLSSVSTAAVGGGAGDLHSRQESSDSGVGMASTYSGAHTPDTLLTPSPTTAGMVAAVVAGNAAAGVAGTAATHASAVLDDNMDQGEDTMLTSLSVDTVVSSAAMMDTPDLPTLDNMDSDDLVPSIQQLDGDGLMSEEILLNDVTSIINENRLNVNAPHTWI